MQNIFRKEYGIIYNCGYTPEFNPIEFAFCKVKNYFRCKPLYNKEETLKLIFDSFKIITSKDCHNFILH
jgi:hypothetical protein